MTRATRAAAGATPRTDYPPFGNQTSRKEWTERLADVTTLRAAIDLLIDWRRKHDHQALEEADVLWIEARIEDRVAVLRFAELSGESIETTTLTGEPIAQACDTAVDEAKAAVDVAALEAVATTFRRRYKPPVMPTVPFMRTETELAEILIQHRSKGWYDEPLVELRRRRAAVLVDEGVADEDAT
ncbi:methane monooxygenase [Mycobacterium sp.]|uniref:methane monooxygenase n=1 Tax=Mycobacterium sp. TaxID=1785 RepID=UPI002CD9EA3D|nr:methane monooxygenase [Mycobacterium sp.]HKP43509.1 methane monooxygenase [Mycobacterium sp.]